METINTIVKFLTSGLAFIVYITIPFVIIIKSIRKQKIPNNSYTPVDDILQGKKGSNTEED